MSDKSPRRTSNVGHPHPRDEAHWMKARGMEPPEPVHVDDIAANLREKMSLPEAEESDGEEES